MENDKIVVSHLRNPWTN